MKTKGFLKATIAAAVLVTTGAAHAQLAAQPAEQPASQTAIQSIPQTTITAAVDMALHKSPDVAIDAAHRRSVDHAVDVAKGGYLPRVDLALGYGLERVKNRTTIPLGTDDKTLHRDEASLTLSQMLYDHGATYHEVLRQKAIQKGNAYKVAGSSENIALRTVEAYLEVLRLREKVGLTKENLATHQKTYDQIKQRADSGVGRKSDQDQAEARLALSKANLIAAEANLRDAEINYMRYTGVYPEGLVKPEGPGEGLMPTTLDEALKNAKDGNPLLKLAMADIEEATAQHNAAKAPMGPQIHLEAGSTHVHNGGGLIGDVNGDQDDAKYAMVRMRYNLYRGGSDFARVRETKELVGEAQEIMKRTMRQLDQSVSLSWNAYTSISERLPNLQQHADSSRLTRDAYVKQFSIGQRTLIDLLDTENEYYTSSVEFNDGQFLELFARYRLMQDMGKLQEALKVKKLEESMVPAS